MTQARLFLVCPECDRETPRFWRGLCNLCYKRTYWRPAKTRGVRHEDEHRTLMRGGVLGFTAADQKCKSCNMFKSRPSDACGYCGDEPVSHDATEAERFEYDRAHGYER